MDFSDLLFFLYFPLIMAKLKLLCVYLIWAHSHLHLLGNILENKPVIFYMLAFGSQCYYNQAQLLIISLLKNSHGEYIAIRVYTDNPSFFSLYSEGAGVEVIPVNPAKLDEMASLHYGYNFANKLQLIQDVSSDPAYAASVFLDTDVVSHCNISDFIKLLRENTLFMYKKERRYDKESTKEYWSALNSIELLNHSIDNHSSQWNSGVVGITPSASNRITDAMKIMDNLLIAGVKQHTPEQVAISVVLEGSGNLHAATDFFIHYHANKGGWEPLSNEIQRKRESGESISSLIEWYNSLTTFPPEAIHKKIMVKIISKWRQSLKKRCINTTTKR